ncbi:MAG: hypothetical protein HYY55_01765 [Candidatus Niyogibacteria bacterium]|nr:MAG: hypothetical protein HYY55_01765 [Candidatus Niyogibacteria bacterium]
MSKDGSAGGDWGEQKQKQTTHGRLLLFLLPPLDDFFTPLDSSHLTGWEFDWAEKYEYPTVILAQMNQLLPSVEKISLTTVLRLFR